MKADRMKLTLRKLKDHCNSRCHGVQEICKYNNEDEPCLILQAQRIIKHEIKKQNKREVKSHVTDYDRQFY